MKKSYDFSKSIKNPYLKKPKKQLTIRLDEDTIAQAKILLEKAGYSAYEPRRERYRCGEDKLSKPCPICSYKYGTKWLFEAVPKKVLEWLAGLPETKVTPAWV